MEIFIPELKIWALEQLPNAHTMCWYRVRPVPILSLEEKEHLMWCAGCKGGLVLLVYLPQSSGGRFTEVEQTKACPASG